MFITDGSRITKLKPGGGFFAREIWGAITLFSNCAWPDSSSTTHTITGAQ